MVRFPFSEKRKQHYITLTSLQIAQHFSRLTVPDEDGRYLFKPNPHPSLPTEQAKQDSNKNLKVQHT